MPIKETIQNGKKSYIVYASGFSREGKRIQKKRRGVSSLREARFVEFQLKKEINDLKDSLFYTWDSWFKRCIERISTEFRHSTVIEYEGKNKHWMEPFWKDKELKSITTHDVHQVVYNPIMNVSWHTRKGTLKIIKRIFNMAIEEGVLSNNPALKVKVSVPQAKQAVLNETEVNILLQEAYKVKHRFYDVWVVALLTGMRSGEMYALKWSDIDFDNGFISVSRSWTSTNGYGPTKTAKNRVVPISPELKKFLLELKLRKEPDNEFVLPHLEEWTHGDQAKVLRDFCEGIGITSVKFHDLRATVITQLLIRGESLARVMAMVGHGELKTTQGYVRIAGQDIVGVTNTLGFKVPNDQPCEVINLSSRNRSS